MINKFSKKRAILEREYKKTLKEIVDSYHGRVYCKGCLTVTGRLSPSHRIARSRNISLIADKNNIDYCCETCHSNVESLDWHLLEFCEEIEAYVEENDSELFAMYLEKKESA